MTVRRTAVFLLAVLAPLPAAAADPFAADGVAFLKKYCLGCHGEQKPKADLSLHKYPDCPSLLKNRKVWDRVQDVLKAGEMPPTGKPKPTQQETDAFLKVVGDTFDAADRAAGPDPGRVTMRRLNKVEYNNTIRDLCLVDLNPSEDFPSDDVGHGFDNIGDVLTLPPVLMERYLAAAESVMARAIVPNPPKPTNRGLGGQYLQPAGPAPPLKGGYRVVSVKPTGTPIETGPLFAPYDVPADAEYTFRARLYAETTGKAPVKVALLACGKSVANPASDEDADTLAGAAVKNLRPFTIIKVAEVTGKSDKASQLLDVKVPADINFDKLALAVVKPADGEPAPTVYIQYFGLEGPLDPRPSSQRKLLASDESRPVSERTRTVLKRFLDRAYRRPATPDEVERIAKLADEAAARGDKWEAAMQYAMTAVLVSPKFLFRVELDGRPAGDQPKALDEFQLASRLSYFLWASMPDDELFALAAKKQLAANLDAQVKRMLQSPKAETLVDRFMMQWLQLQPLRAAQPDAKKFPAFNDQLRAAMFKETELFLGAVIKEDRSVLDVIDADFTFLNPPLAKLYGILDTAGNKVGSNAKTRKPGGVLINRGNEFVRVNVAGTDRGGILTQASVLTVTSNPGRTSPVKRGKWVLEQLLGAPPPPPPPNVPELEADTAVATGSLRQRMEQHRKNPSCAGCHAKMDPLGFGLENFDAVGGFRTQDGTFAIDPSGVLPDGKSFAGPSELKAILKEKKDQFARCLAEKMLTYALGRGLEYYDKRAVDKIVADLAKNDYRFSALAAGIAQSDPFRLRRGKDQP